jgi:predicted dehydrogenase
MPAEGKASVSRRDFIKNSGRVAAATTLAASIVPPVHAAGNETIQVALIGCGSRGTGAAADAMAVKHCPVKLVAMADVFQFKMNSSIRALRGEYGDAATVPKERQFIGFDAYRHAMDCLKPGDIAIFATPLAFRWVHFGYAIQKGLNVFMEKPLTADGPTSRRMLDLAKQADQKNLKVGVGLMSRHNRALQELAERIHGGEIGDLILLRGYRMDGPAASFRSLRKPDNISEVAYQIQRFHSFLWASGGCFSDFNIHIIDHCCWMKNAWPVEAQALGGRHYRGEYVDQNFDTYSVEYSFADGSKFIMDGRCIDGCKDLYHSFAHGTKGVAILSRSGDCGSPSGTFRGLGLPSATFENLDSLRKDRIWESKTPRGEGSPYRNEWNDLVDAVLKNKPYNEVERGVQASLATSMGRRAAHTGQIVTWEQMLNSDHEFAPMADKLTMDGPAPLKAGANGRYPVPQPGIVTDREY